MDIPLDRDSAGWRPVLATLFWLIVALGGLSLMMALQPILFALGKATMSGDVTGVVMDKYRIVSVRNFGLMFYGLIWLGGVIGLHAYYVNSRSIRQLLTRFGTVLFIEAGIWGLSFLVQDLAMR